MQKSLASSKGRSGSINPSTPISEHAFNAINQTMTQHSFAYPEKINLKNIYPKKKPRKEI